MAKAPRASHRIPSAQRLGLELGKFIGIDGAGAERVVRDQRLIFLKDDSRWAGLRQEPRFKALMVKLRLDRFGKGLSPT